MDNNISWVMQQKAARTIENLNKNNMEGYFVQNEEELLEKLKELMKEGETVALGGSMTLFETGVIDFIRNGKFNLLDRYKKGLSPDEIKEIYRKSFFADTYLVSSNAITENGELFNVDGRGNRVAAMIFGPDSVIVIAGINKIVKDVNEAVSRNKNIAAPANSRRLNLKCPCVKTGYCVDCSSGDRICNDYVLIKRQPVKGRIKVIIVNKDLGY